VQRFQDCYGHEEVKSWCFEVWNEQDLQDDFFTGSEADYCKLYVLTSQAIKNVSPDYRVGGPAAAIGQLDPAFVDFDHTKSQTLDFISTHA